MAISNEVRRAGPFIGNGTQKEFPFAFVVLQPSDVAVYLFDGVSGSKADSSTFNVTLNDNQDNNPGGLVTLYSPIPVGRNLSIISEMPFTQPMVLTNRGGFYPEIINTSADRTTIMCQQLKEEVDRSLKVPVASEETPEELGERLLSAQDDARKYADQAQASADSAASSVIEVKKYADATLTISPYVKYLKPIADDIGSIVTIAPHLEDIKQVSQIATEVEIVGDMGTSVITLSQHIPVLDEVAKHSQAIQVVAADFKGQIACPNIHDFGIFGEDDVPTWTPTGGAISGVAENIEDVKTTADLKEKIEFIITNWDDIESAIAIMQGNVLLKQNNLSDLLSVATARANLGLGTMATANLDLGEWNGN